MQKLKNVNKFALLPCEKNSLFGSHANLLDKFYFIWQSRWTNYE